MPPRYITIPRANELWHKNILSSFTPVAKDDVLTLLVSAKTNTIDLDRIPFSLVRNVLVHSKLLLLIIINYSLKEGNISNHFKIAHVTPLLKKESVYKSFQSSEVTLHKIKNDISICGLREGSWSNIIRSLHSFQHDRSVYLDTIAERLVWC